ncbi:hypothetical protein FO519_005198 [Halicephalobus sp. NKZ332]|nr:hypothetical protein FO519_005198 [Halicephalobus sp. NKZ332]
MIDWYESPERIFMTTGGHVARMIVLGIICERLLATIRWKTYERNAKFQRAIGYSFGFGVLVVSFILAFLTNITNMSLQDKLIVIEVIHGITIVLALYLHWKNKRLHKLTKLRPLLSERYQLFENIRTLSLVWPYIIIGTVLSSLAPISSNFLQQNPSTFSLGVPVLYLIYNINILFAFLFFACSVFYSKKIKRVNESENMEQGIRTVTGRYVPRIETHDDHFEKLRQAWH